MTETAQHTRGDDLYCKKCARPWPCRTVLLAQRDALLAALVHLTERTRFISAIEGSRVADVGMGKALHQADDAIAAAREES